MVYLTILDNRSKLALLACLGTLAKTSSFSNIRITSISRLTSVFSVLSTKIIKGELFYGIKE